jgi:hypothetical protein
MNTSNAVTHKRVSVVIPTWNGRDLILACLESLSRQTFRDFEAIVVDDGSTDDSVDCIKTRFPDVTLISLEKNLGFCGAVNKGIENSTGDLVVLLNNDMTLASDFLERLVAAADTTDAALLAPLVLWRDEPNVIYSAGDAQRRNGRPESIGFRCSVDGFAFRDEVFGVSAGAALYRREVFETAGLFDPAYGIYFSDSDLSFRARLAGFRARFVRDAVAWHIGSASLFGKTLKRTQQCCVNHVLLILKNMPFRLIVRHAPAIVAERVHQVRRLYSAARTEYGARRAALIVVQTLCSIPLLLPHAFSERRRIQRSRKISIGELERLLSE